MTTAIARPPLLTVEEFARRPDPGYPEELVRGRIVKMPPPNRRHGQVCMQAARIFDSFVVENDLGHVLINDAGVITERNPDTLRGPDIAYYSYQKLPKGPLPPSYGPEMPELVIEVRSPGNSWTDLQRKVGELLNAGTLCVIVLDPETEQAYVFDDQGPRVLKADAELTLPAILPGFSVPVGRFFA